MEKATADEQELISRWIERNPHKPSDDEVRIRDTGIPVWALIGNLPAVDGDLKQLASEYEIPEEAARAAFAYYQKHRAAIDVRLAQNATA